MAKTPDDEKSRKASARRAGMRIIVRDGVRVDERAPAGPPAKSTPAAAPTAAAVSERHDRKPRRETIEEALRRRNRYIKNDRTTAPSTNEKLRRRQREQLKRVYARRRAREVDCRHNQCKLCRGTGVMANGEPCIDMIACGCARCSPLRPTLLATNGTC